MNSDEPLFASILRRKQEAEAKAEIPLENRCIFARDFATSLEEICGPLLKTRTLISLNQAKVLLLDKYFEWRAYVPKSHRSRMAETGHTCIFYVFEEAYRQIKLAELALAPPRLYEPPQLPMILPPEPPQIPPPPTFSDMAVDEPQ